METASVSTKKSIANKRSMTKMSTTNTSMMTTTTATAMIEKAHEILSTLPPSPIAFAYGSAIVPQKNVNPQTRMIDLIIVVKDARKWHHENLTRNPSHYSFPMNRLGESMITMLQHSTYGPQIYYNTILSSPSAFKYGVIDLQHLRQDLFTWQSLYVSGRLHKPVHYLTHQTTPPSLVDAINANLDSAAAAALLMLPEQFDEAQLYAMIAKLSYLGDVRMNLPLEPTTKPHDLVMPNISQYQTLYQSTTPLSNYTNRNRHGVFTRDMHSKAQFNLLNFLPKSIRHHVAYSLTIEMHHSHSQNSGKDIQTAMISKAVMATLAAVVSRSSVSQAVKGLVTAGFTNSLKYVNAKLQKSLRTTRLSYFPTIRRALYKNVR